MKSKAKFIIMQILQPLYKEYSNKGVFFPRKLYYCLGRSLVDYFYYSLNESR